MSGAIYGPGTAIPHGADFNTTVRDWVPIVTSSDIA